MRVKKGDVVAVRGNDRPKRVVGEPRRNDTDGVFTAADVADGTMWFGVEESSVVEIVEPAPTEG